MNRLTETKWGITTTTYTYDPNANRLTHVNAVDPLTEADTHLYDANGNLVTDPNATYKYDAANRLITVTQDGVSYSYTYNGLGDRLSQTVDGGTPTKYTLDISQGLTQVLSDGATTYLCGNGRIGQYDTAWTYPGHRPAASALATL